MKKAVIFDLDGTLADTIECLAYCTNQILSELGLVEIAEEEFKTMVGDGAAKQIERALIKAGNAQLSYFDRALELYLDFFEKNCTYRVKPYAGIEETLQRLKKEGMKLAVLSNKPHPMTLNVIHSLFGDNLFDAIAGQKPGIAKKPSPEGVFAILEELGVSAEETLYLGDTNTDMKTGKGAGLFTIGVLWGFRDRKELEENHADAIIAKPEEIFKHLS